MSAHIPCSVFNMTVSNLSLNIYGWCDRHATHISIWYSNSWRFTVTTMQWNCTCKQWYSYWAYISYTANWFRCDARMICFSISLSWIRGLAIIETTNSDYFRRKTHFNSRSICKFCGNDDDDETQTPSFADNFVRYAAIEREQTLNANFCIALN